MTVGLLIGSNELHTLFYKSCPDRLIDADIQFVLPSDLILADVLVTTLHYLDKMPPAKDKPIILFSDTEDNLFLDERILAVIPFPTETDGFEVLADVLLVVKENLQKYKDYLNDT